MRTDRNLLIGVFCVDGTSVFVADHVLPIVAEIDKAFGEVRRVTTLEVDSTDAEHPTATALAVHDGSLWISSPAAGGMVRIDLETNESVLVPLDSMPGPIASLGNDLIVVAYPEWQSSEEEASRVVSDRPIVWSSPGPGAAFDEAEVDAAFDVPRPVWRIGRHGAERVDLGGDVTDTVALDNDQLFAAVRRADHPVVLTADYFGGASFSYPVSVVRFDQDLRGEILAELQDSGTLFATDSEVWCLDYGAGGLRQPALKRVQPPGPTWGIAEAGVTVDALLDTEAIVVENAPSLHDDAGPKAVAHVIGLLDESKTAVIELPARIDQFCDQSPMTNGSDIWWVTESLDALVSVDVPGRTARLLPVVVHTAAYRTRPSPPQDSSLAITTPARWKPCGPNFSASGERATDPGTRSSAASSSTPSSSTEVISPMPHRRQVPVGSPSWRHLRDPLVPLRRAGPTRGHRLLGHPSHGDSRDRWTPGARRRPSGRARRRLDRRDGQRTAVTPTTPRP